MLFFGVLRESSCYRCGDEERTFGKGAGLGPARSRDRILWGCRLCVPSSSVSLQPWTRDAGML